jgi:multiple sugar transport system substrate-binding protein
MTERTRRALLSGTAVAAVSAGGALLGACAAPAPARKQLAPASLTYTTWWLPPLMSGVATEKAAQAFQQKFPHVTVRVEPLSDPAAAKQMEKVQTMAAGGAPPDISLLRPQYPGGFAARGLLLPLDDRLQRDQRAARSDFIPVQLERSTWQGKLWGLPAEAWFLITYYNPAIFARAGQTPPTESWTWDSWLEAAKRIALLPPDSGARVFATDDANMWEPLVWAWGGEILSKSEKESLLNKAPAPEAIQWRADLTHKHGVVPTAQDLAEVKDGMRGLFQQGRLGMFTTGNWALTDVQAGAQMPWAVAPLPQGKAGRVTLGSGAIYGAFKDGKQQDAAWELLADLVMGDAARVMATESSMLPSLKSMIRPEALPHYKPEWLRVIQQVTGGARQPHYNHPRYIDINQIYTEQLAPVWRGQRPAKDATDEIVRQVTPLLG